MADSIDFARVLEHLHDLSQPFPAKELYQFSDLTRKELAALEAAWPAIDVERRRGVMHDLGELGDANFEVRFDDVYRLGLDDADPEVRVTAIINLWESEAPDLMAPLMTLMQSDPEAEVRAAAASALGRFVYLGEVEEIPAPQARRVEAALLAVINGPDELEVRRRALEAIAFSGREEVAPLIEAAYAAPDHKLRVSALFAMGRSADSQRWREPVLAELENADPEMRFEAVRAAGELELQEAVPALQAHSHDGDPQVREAVIWSLGQMGGEPAREALLALLDEAETEEERDYIEEALENHAFQDEMLNFPILQFTEDELDDLDEFEDDDVPPLSERLN